MKKPLYNNPPAFLFLIFGLAVSIFASESQAQSILNCGTRLYPGDASSTDSSIREFVKVRTLNDGTIFHGGQADEGADANISLTKTSPDGTINWQKIVGTEGLDVLKNFIITSDGGFVLVGWTIPTGGTYADALVIKLNANGELDWARNFGGTDDDEAFGATELSNGDFLITGTTYSFGPKLRNAFAFRITNSGDMVWSKAYAKGSYNYFIDAISLPNGESIACGYTWLTTGSTIFDPMFVKLDADGNAIWGKWIKMNSSQIVYDFEKDIDGGIVFGGVSTVAGGAPNQNFISKVDANGNHQWTKLFGTPNGDRIWDLSVLPSGKYIAVGFAGKDASDSGPRNGFIARLGSNGLVEESILIGSEDTVTTTFTGVSVSGDFLVANGFTYKNGHETGAGISVRMPHSDFSQTCGSVAVSMNNSSLTGIDSAGVISSEGGSLMEIDINQDINNLELENICTFTQTGALVADKIQFHPNPGNGLFRISGSVLRAEVLAADGRLMMQSEGPLETLDLRFLPDGLYRIRVQVEGDKIQSVNLLKVSR
jgi:hypothetical protein